MNKDEKQAPWTKRGYKYARSQRRQSRLELLRRHNFQVVNKHMPKWKYELLLHMAVNKIAELKQDTVENTFIRLADHYNDLHTREEGDNLTDLINI